MVMLMDSKRILELRNLKRKKMQRLKLSLNSKSSTRSLKYAEAAAVDIEEAVAVELREDKSRELSPNLMTVMMISRS